MNNVTFLTHLGHRHFDSKVNDFDMVSSHDKEKQKLCKTLGITMIHIPYWWDGSIDSLKVREVSPKLKFR